MRSEAVLIRTISMKNSPLFSDVGQQGGIFHNLTQGFHHSGSEMLKNKGEFFITGGIFHRNSPDRSNAYDLKQTVMKNIV